LIKKLWAKFVEEELICTCTHESKKCDDEKECKEYVCKFTDIDRDNYNNSFHKHILTKKNNKLINELNKTTKHIRNITKRIR